LTWKTPFRPREDNGVTQNLSDGVVTVYAVEDVAQPGYQPQLKLKIPPKAVLRYEEQRLGIQRYYSGRQNQIQIERVLRVPRYGCVTNQDVAVTEDGRQYRIDLVQTVQDVYPGCMDLTLAKIEQEFEVQKS
jgi:hypothetical protein